MFSTLCFAASEKLLTVAFFLRCFRKQRVYGVYQSTSVKPHTSPSKSSSVHERSIAFFQLSRVWRQNLCGDDVKMILCFGQSIFVVPQHFLKCPGLEQLTGQSKTDLAFVEEDRSTAFVIARRTFRPEISVQMQQE